jgi:glycosyltransferase involved in cell wall biosynthesis
MTGRKAVSAARDAARRREFPDIEPNTATAATKDPPVVLQILPSLETGGVERGTVDIAQALVKAGWTSLVASAGGTMVREVQRAGATHIDLPADSKNPLVMWRNIERIADLVRMHRVDILHARSRAPAWSALAAAQRTGVAFVTTFHGNYAAGNPAKRWYNSVMARGDRVIAISEFIGEQVCTRYGADPAKVRIIPRGVDTTLFDPGAVTAQRVIQLAEQWRLPDDVRVVMLPGRLTRWKGHWVLIEALGRLKDRAGLRCLLVGSDQGRTAYVRELETEIARRGLQGTVQIAGNCRDMAAAFMLADVVVSTSVEAEAFGRVIAEAQAMGRPVIATDHGAARETVVHGETGWLVPPGDASALADALREALALDAQSREALAARVIANVRAEYTRELMCDRTLSVYREVLAGKRGNAG